MKNMISTSLKAGIAAVVLVAASGCVSQQTVDEIKATADKAVQDKYGVKYHQFWFNEDTGMVFCLAEGPDMETVEKVHQTAHGNLPCNMVEIMPRLTEK